MNKVFLIVVILFFASIQSYGNCGVPVRIEAMWPLHNKPSWMHWSAPDAYLKIRGVSARGSKIYNVSYVWDYPRFGPIQSGRQVRPDATGSSMVYLSVLFTGFVKEIPVRIGQIVCIGPGPVVNSYHLWIYPERSPIR